MTFMIFFSILAYSDDSLGDILGSFLVLSFKMYSKELNGGSLFAFSSHAYQDVCYTLSTILLY